MSNMELVIYNPAEDGFLKSIEWNFEELKQELTARSEEYRTVVYTSDEQIRKVAKADRAKLRKLTDAFDTERKRIKKQCMEPVTAFEKQVKELTGIIDVAVKNIDDQIKAYEENKRNEKLARVKEIYEETVPGALHDFLPFEVVMTDRYLLSGTTLKSIKTEIQALSDKTADDITVIENLPEYSFEAMEKYRKTLDLQTAMRTVNDLRESAERKRVYQEGRKTQAEAYRRQREEEALKTANSNSGFTQSGENAQVYRTPKTVQNPDIKSDAAVYVVGLNIHGTREQLDAFCRFLNSNGIRYDVTQKPQREE